MKGPATYPKNHQFGMRVPKGGSNCAKCRFLGKDHKTCDNEHFQKWNGSKFLPLPDEVYCCDVFEAAKEQAGQRFGSVRDSSKE